MDTGQGTEEWARRFHVLPAGERPPSVLAEQAGLVGPVLVWRNELGGQTWRIGDRYLKWSPDPAGIDLRNEVARMRWLHGRFPAPRVLDAGHDGRGSWFLSAALRGASAVGGQWLEEPKTAVRAIATGLRLLHGLDAAGLPATWESWVTRRPLHLGRPPLTEELVVVHGDACAPNTLIDREGVFAGLVDVGDLVLGDRWADLAVASMSLDWNFGPGWQSCFFDAYGVRPDEERIDYFRRLWAEES